MTATNVIALHQEEEDATPEELRAMAMNLVARIRRCVRGIIKRKEQLSGTTRALERAARMMREAANPFDLYPDNSPEVSPREEKRPDFQLTHLTMEEKPCFTRPTQP